MTDDERDSLKIELDIFNLPFRLRAPADEHDRLRRAARHVNDVMRELVVNRQSPDSTRLAIQAAFLIAHDYIKLMEDTSRVDGVNDETRRRVDELLRRLDESLSQL